MGVSPVSIPHGSVPGAWGEGSKAQKTSVGLWEVGFGGVIKSTVQLADTAAVAITVLIAFHLF